MSSTVSVCSQRGVFKLDVTPPGMLHPADSINKRTTPEGFTDKWSQTPAYGLRYLGPTGCTALHTAAKTGNIPMIEYIARGRIGAKNLLNLGNRNWHTPLFVAIQLNQRSAARVLILLGAEVNMKCLDFDLDLPYPGARPRRTDCMYRTPLSFAIQGRANFCQGVHFKAERVAMAKLLLIHKGIAEPKPTMEEDLQILEQAQKEIDGTRIELFKKITDSTSADVETTKTIISYVPLDEIPDAIPEGFPSDWIAEDIIKTNSYTIQWSQRFNPYSAPL